MSKNLKSATFLFEPIPPSTEATPHPLRNQGSTIRRRIQSAKAVRGNNFPACDRIKERPRSAVLPSEKSRLTGKPPSGRNVRLLTGQNLNLELPTEYLSKRSSPWQESGRTPKVEAGIESPTAKQGPSDVEIPSGIAEVAPWLTPDTGQRLIGVDPGSCLVFLPMAIDCDDLPVVPPVQDSCDSLRYTTMKQKDKPFDPKKLFHYNVLKNRPRSADHVCDHRRKLDSVDIQAVYSRDGKLLYDERNYHGNRTKDVIQKEIEDLEKLLQGIGSEDSDNEIVRYQHDINVLQRTATETLARHSRPQGIEQPSQDLMGLRAYLKEKERMIQRIKEQRKRCIRELEQLDTDFGIKVTITPQPRRT